MNQKPNPDEKKPDTKIDDVNKDLNIDESSETNIATTEKPLVELQAVDLTKPLPNLSESEIIPIDLMADYWTPEKIGECRRLFFDKLQMRKVQDMQTGAVIDLLCVYFVEKTEGDDGAVKTISNGSKRLVGIFEGGAYQRGTPFLITYLGKKKNKVNTFMSDQWSVKPLLIKI